MLQLWVMMGQRYRVDTVLHVRLLQLQAAGMAATIGSTIGTIGSTKLASVIATCCM